MPPTSSKPSAAEAVATAGHDDENSVASLDIGACCYCHSSLDYSDRAAFFQKDRFEDYDDDDMKDTDSHKSYVFRPHDPYLPLNLYNPNNALVYCDSCDRLYHQQCHPVPLIVLPRGAWHCLYCQSQQQQHHQQPSPRKKKKHDKTGTTTKTTKRTTTTQKQHTQPKKKAPDPLLQFWESLSSSSLSPDDLFASPPQRTASTRPYEQAWFLAVSHNSAYATHALLTKQLPKSIRGQLGTTYSLTQAFLQTWTSTHKNRQHMLYSSAAAARTKPTTSQAAVDTLVKQAACHYKIQMWLQSLEQVRSGRSSSSSSSSRSRAGAGIGTSAARHVGHSPDSPQQTFQTLVDWCRAYCSSHQKQQQQAAITTKNGQTMKRRAPKNMASSSSWKTPQEQTQQQTLAASNNWLPDDFVQRVIFPFGIPAHTWFPPRTPEFLLNTETSFATDAIKNRNKKNQSTRKTKHDNSDDDSGISLDGLTCCVCLTSDATDDNDLLLCDGHGCFRAYHMRCVYPAVTLQDLGEEDDDWFCPLCCGVADLIHLVQTEYMGDEWEQRRIVRQIENDGRKTKAPKSKKPNKRDDDGDDDDTDNDSLQSWTHVDQVFPNAEWEYETALALQKGTQNADTDALLRQVFGWEKGDGNDELDEDEDNVEEDGHFDLEAFHDERRREREQRKGENDRGKASNGDDDNDQSSTPSSQATLVDMSSVELEINKDELAALSEAEDSSSSENEDESDSIGNARRSKRLRKHHPRQGESDDGNDSNRDPGKLDEANIILGKRARKPVDYIKLNNAIFGDLSDGEAANLDDIEEFRQRQRSPQGSDNDDDGDEGVSNNSSDDENNDNHKSSHSGEEDDSDDIIEKKVKANKKPSAKTAVKQSSVSAKRPTRSSAKCSSSTRLTKKIKNGKERVIPNQRASARSSKRQKINSMTTGEDETSTKPKKNEVGNVRRKETTNGVRNPRGASIAQKALNLVSSLVSSPVRNAS